MKALRGLVQRIIVTGGFLTAALIIGDHVHAAAKIETAPGIRTVSTLPAYPVEQSHGQSTSQKVDFLRNGVKLHIDTVIEPDFHEGLIHSALSFGMQQNRGSQQTLLSTAKDQLSDQLKARRLSGDGQLAELKRSLAPLEQWMAQQTMQLVVRARNAGNQGSADARRVSALINSRKTHYQQLKAEFSAIQNRNRRIETLLKELMSEMSIGVDRGQTLHEVSQLRRGAWKDQAVHRTELAGRSSARRSWHKTRNSARRFAEDLSDWSLGRLSASPNNAIVNSAKAEVSSDDHSRTGIQVAGQAQLPSRFVKAKAGNFSSFGGGLYVSGPGSSSNPLAGVAGNVWVTMPVTGDLVAERENQNAVYIAVYDDQPAVAPGRGKIIYADKFKNFGRLLIIDHGHDYHTLLAGLARIDVAVGDDVIAGQLVGFASRSVQQEDTLYMELRHRGVPVNPNPWLAQKHSRKVQG